MAACVVPAAHHALAVSHVWLAMRIGHEDAAQLGNVRRAAGQQRSAVHILVNVLYGFQPSVAVTILTQLSVRFIAFCKGGVSQK